MINITTYFFKNFVGLNEGTWLRKLLALFVMYKCVYWCLDFELLFSKESIMYYNQTKVALWRMPVFILFLAKSSILSCIFILVAAILALNVLILRKHLRLTFFILWFIVSNINNGIFSSLSGGEYLFQQLLFFSIFLTGQKNFSSASLTELDKAFHNLGILALRIQVCLVYFLAGYTKLLDDDWLCGNAVNDVFKIHDFSLPFFYGGTFLSTFLTYTVIAYQLLFPVLVWFHKIKKWFLLIGIVQHLFIAFIIGLPSFGIIMIIAYSVFYVPNSKLKNS